MRKLRTRPHIIEDLGFNFVERHILKAGFTVQRYDRNDYGYDGIIHTFNLKGEIESFSILFQLKSTDAIKFVERKEGFGFDLSIRDLELWLEGSVPVLMILYDAVLEKAYFVDLQPHFNGNPVLLQNVRKFVRLFIPTSNLFEPQAIQKIRDHYHGQNS